MILQKGFFHHHMYFSYRAMLVTVLKADFVNAAVMADGPTPVPSEGQNVKGKLLKSKPRYQEKIMNTF